MNLYEIVNTETGETIKGGMSYTEAGRYMQTNQLDTKTHEIRLDMPVRRKVETTEAEAAEIEKAEMITKVQEIITDYYEIKSASNSPIIKVGFRDKRTAAIKLAQLENLGIEAQICGNPAWIAFHY